MFVGATPEKLLEEGGGFFAWKTKLIQNFHKGEI